VGYASTLENGLAEGVAGSVVNPIDVGKDVAVRDVPRTMGLPVLLSTTFVWVNPRLRRNLDVY
jgi:hypothetical protein